MAGRCTCQFKFVAVFPDGRHGRCMVCDGTVVDRLAPGGAADTPAGRAGTRRTEGASTPEAGAKNTLESAVSPAATPP